MPDWMSRRELLRYGALFGGGFALDGLLPAWARSETQGLVKPGSTVSGTDIALAIGHTPFAVDGETGHAITINGTVPAPLVRLKQGQT
ncbi:MAG: copper resistance system multicopper oxidase, partial [Vicinamibacterales bacterium]